MVLFDLVLRVITFRYKVRWYATPLPVQRLILLLLQRGNKSFGLRVGGMFVSSLECFATVQNIFYITLQVPYKY